MENNKMTSLSKSDANFIINVFGYWDKDIQYIEDMGLTEFAQDLRDVFDKHMDIYKIASKVETEGDQ